MGQASSSCMGRTGKSSVVDSSSQEYRKQNVSTLRNNKVTPQEIDPKVDQFASEDDDRDSVTTTSESIVGEYGNDRSGELGLYTSTDEDNIAYRLLVDPIFFIGWEVYVDSFGVGHVTSCEENCAGVTSFQIQAGFKSGPHHTFIHSFMLAVSRRKNASFDEFVENSVFEKTLTQDETMRDYQIVFLSN